MNNNLVYAVVAIVMVLVLAVVLLGNNSHAPSSTATTVGSSASQNTSTGTSTVNPYNTTTTAVVTNTTVSNSTASSGCTAGKYYTCTGPIFAKSSFTVTVGQDTGLNWSSFGIAFAPNGTSISSGVPSGIVFYSANTSSTSNVGTSLPNGSTVNVTLPLAYANITAGSIWVCYTNSGLVYVGNGCIANGGGSKVATYVEIATVKG